MNKTEEMSIPEALEALEEIRKRSPGTDIWRKEVTKILDAVYEAGRACTITVEKTLHDDDGHRAW